MSHKVLTSMPHEWVCHSSVVCDAKNDLFAFGLHSTKLHMTQIQSLPSSHSNSICYPLSQEQLKWPLPHKRLVTTTYLPQVSYEPLLLR